MEGIMIRLDNKQLNNKLEFIDQYLKAGNAADGSKLDANANVTTKNIATLEAEINNPLFQGGLQKVGS